MNERPKIDDLIDATSIESLEAEIDELENDMARLSAGIELRNQAIEWKRAKERLRSGEPPMKAPPSPPTAAKSRNDGLRGKAAIRAVVAENDLGLVWTIPAMLEAIKSHGWEANTHSVQVNLSRMARDGYFTKPADGRYLPVADRFSNLSNLLSHIEGGDGNS